jgi:hypothetical protein
MSGMTAAVELDVRAVRGPRDGAPSSVVLGERGQPESPTVALAIGTAEAHTLHHELHAEDTPRAHALRLVERIVGALGGRPTRARLGYDASQQTIGILEIETETAVLVIEVCASQAVALAAQLRLALVADPELWAQAQRRTALEDAVAELVNGLQS